MFPDMLERVRKRLGFTVGQVAWRIGVSVQEYRELEGRNEPSGVRHQGPDLQALRWSQSFVGKGAQRRPAVRASPAAATSALQVGH
jgi:hypothetical protein